MVLGNKGSKFDNYFACGFDLCPLSEAILYNLQHAFVRCPEFRDFPYLGGLKCISLVVKSIGGIRFVRCILEVSLYFCLFEFTLNFVKIKVCASAGICIG